MITTPHLGLAMEFCFEKIPRNRLEMVSIIPRKKVLIPRFTEESIPRLGTEENGMKKISFTKIFVRIIVVYTMFFHCGMGEGGTTMSLNWRR